MLPGPRDLEPTAQQEFVLDFLKQHVLSNIPSIPKTTRPLQFLKADSRVWWMSLGERKKLYKTWCTAASELIHQTQVTDFEKLRWRHANAMKF